MDRMLPIADAASSKAISSKELQHVQELLTAYEAADNIPAPTGSTSSSSSAGNASSSSAQPAATAAAAAAGASNADAEGEAGASWAGEEYEPDNVRCMQRSYLKFMKRLARQPQQCARWVQGGAVLQLGDRSALLCLNCSNKGLPGAAQVDGFFYGSIQLLKSGMAPLQLRKSGPLRTHSNAITAAAAAVAVACCRYCHNGPVLWPQSKLPEPSPCQSCGGPRVFELQLMPALSQLVLEAAGMTQEMELDVDATGTLLQGCSSCLKFVKQGCSDTWSAGMPLELPLLCKDTWRALLRQV